MDFLTLIGFSILCLLLFYTVICAISDCDAGLFIASKFGTKLDFFRNKVVWITGASSGIGEHLSLQLARHGAKLVLSARNIQSLERVRNLCEGLGLSRDDILVLPLDVTEVDKQDECFLRVIQKFGKLDILVNNAGRSQRANWEDISLQVDKEMFEVNVFGAVSLSRIAVRYFGRSGGGHIVLMSSVAGVIGAPFSATYTGTKHALHGYFKSLRFEKLDKNIDISFICPGPVVSNVLSQSFTENPGEIYGHEMVSSEKRMPTERCAYLSAVAIANKIQECWIGIFPIIPLTYVAVYFPTAAFRLIKFLGPSYVQKLRDNQPLKSAAK